MCNRLTSLLSQRTIVATPLRCLPLLTWSAAVTISYCDQPWLRLQHYANPLTYTHTFSTHTTSVCCMSFFSLPLYILLFISVTCAVQCCAGSRSARSVAISHTKAPLLICICATKYRGQLPLQLPASPTNLSYSLHPHTIQCTDTHTSLRYPPNRPGPPSLTPRGEICVSSTSYRRSQAHFPYPAF